MRIFRGGKRRKKMQQQIKAIEAEVGEVIARRHAAIANLECDLAATRSVLGFALVSLGETGAVLNAQRAIWNMQQDMTWPEVIKRWESGVAHLRGGGDGGLAAEKRAQLQQLCDKVVSDCDAHLNGLACVRNAKAFADANRAALSDISEDRIVQMVMAAPGLAQVVFQGKRIAVDGIAEATSLLAATLDTRIEQLQTLSHLPHRKTVSRRTRALVNLAAASSGGGSVGDLHAQLESVSQAASAVHRDQFRGYMRRDKYSIES